jgi:hypothetical protein
MLHAVTNIGCNGWILIRCPLVVMGQLNNTYIHKINAELARCRVAQFLALVPVVFKENTVWQILEQRSTRIKESHEHV